MKTVKKLLCILFLCPQWSLYSQTTLVTESGSFEVSCPEYVDNVNRTWNIDIGGRSVLLDYHVRVEHTYDRVLVYSIDDSGTAALQATLTGSQDGRIQSLYPNGKMRVVFTSNNSGNCSTNPLYSGFEITVSPIIGIAWYYDGSGSRTSREILLDADCGGVLRSGVSKEEEEETVFTEKVRYRSGDTKPEADIRIYPNPTEGRFAVEIGGVPGDIPGEIHLYDSQGKLMEKKDIHEEGRVEFDLSGKPDGIYLLNIHLDGNVSTWKIIKK